MESRYNFMSSDVKKSLSFILPTLLAAFIIADTFIPLFSQKNESQAKRQISSVAAPVRAQVAAPQRLQIPDGHYYSFKANYTCEDQQSNQKIASYAESYRVQNGKICHTGDACSQLNDLNCQNQPPAGLQLARNRETFTLGQMTFRRLKNPVPPECPIQSCGPLPETCRYEHMPPLDDKGCPQGCGTIVCQPQLEACAPLKCTAPPQNCEYKSELARDPVSGCAVGCGDLTCDTISTKVIQCATEVKCAKLPENCSYKGATYAADGCKTNCGEVECRRVDEKLASCAAPPICSKLPQGCYYAGEAETNEQGCVVGCRSMVCKSQIPARCAPPACEPAPPNCRYDGNSPLNFEGCATGCGQLICH